MTQRIAILGFIIFSICGFVSFESKQYEIPEVKFPKDNPFSVESIALGKLMFFDKRMSRDSSLSCASCHRESNFFSDGLIKSIGMKGAVLDRNSPSLMYVAFQDSGLMWDRGVPSLEMQILVPVQEHKEFDFNLKYIAERFKRDTILVNLAQKAYNREIDEYVITRAIANFERSLISFNSKYDKVMQGSEVFSKDEIDGYRLFYGKGKCDECHSGILFTNNSLKNNGLYNYPYNLDSGRMNVSKNEEDRDLFKVPSLRNVANTAPYMHDGSIESLESVLKHYANGGFMHKNKSPILNNIRLSVKEQKHLVAFLKTLTDKY